MKRILAAWIAAAVIITASASETSSFLDDSSASAEETSNIAPCLTTDFGPEANAEREYILNWVDIFKRYFEDKDFEALSKVFSDDFLRFKGGRMLQTEGFGKSMDKQSKAKEMLLSFIKRSFLSCKPLDVEIDYVSVLRHASKQGIYGLTFHLILSASSYQDSGWIFMFWDFNDKEAPVSYIRTWQSDEVVEEDGIYSLEDFFIP